MADVMPSQGHSPKVESPSVIDAGDSVLVKLPNNEVRSVKINKNSWVPHFANRALKLTSLRTVPLGRFGSFHANELIGQPYGLTYEIVEKKLQVIRPRSIQEVGMRFFRFLCLALHVHVFTEDTDATNEYINDGDFVQPLTLQEIQTLKQSGVHASVGIVNLG